MQVTELSWPEVARLPRYERLERECVYLTADVMSSPCTGAIAHYRVSKHGSFVLCQGHAREAATI